MPVGEDIADGMTIAIAEVLFSLANDLLFDATGLTVRLSEPDAVRVASHGLQNPLVRRDRLEPIERASEDVSSARPSL